MKMNQKSIEPNRSDCCSIGSVIEHNRTGTFRLVRLPNSIETHPVSIESERSPSGMHLKQFENKNISINRESTKIYIV